MRSSRSICLSSSCALGVLVALCGIFPRAQGIAGETSSVAVTIANPIHGQAVSGKNVSIVVTYSSEAKRTISKLDLLIDGRSNFTEQLQRGQSWGASTYVWDTTLFADGMHTLTVKATDSASSVGTATVSVYVANNTVDRTPPIVSIISPAANIALRGKVPVVMQAADNVGVAWVLLFIDDKFESLMNYPPYTFLWDTTKPRYPNGTHILLAKAFDAAENQGISLPVPVTVDNPGGKTMLSPLGSKSQTATGLPPVSPPKPAEAPSQLPSAPAPVPAREESKELKPAAIGAVEQPVTPAVSAKTTGNVEPTTAGATPKARRAPESPVSVIPTPSPRVETKRGPVAVTPAVTPQAVMRRDVPESVRHVEPSSPSPPARPTVMAAAPSATAVAKAEEVRSNGSVTTSSEKRVLLAKAPVEVKPELESSLSVSGFLGPASPKSAPASSTPVFSQKPVASTVQGEPETKAAISDPSFSASANGKGMRESLPTERRALNEKVVKGPARESERATSEMTPAPSLPSLSQMTKVPVLSKKPMTDEVFEPTKPDIASVSTVTSIPAVVQRGQKLAVPRERRTVLSVGFPKGSKGEVRIAQAGSARMSQPAGSIQVDSLPKERSKPVVRREGVQTSSRSSEPLQVSAWLAGSPALSVPSPVRLAMAPKVTVPPSRAVETSNTEKPVAGTSTLASILMPSKDVAAAEAAEPFPSENWPDDTTSRPAPSEPKAITKAVCAPTCYVVRPGDTLTDISAKFGVRSSVIRKINHLGKSSVLRAGKSLSIPQRPVQVWFNRNQVQFDVSPFMRSGLALGPFRHIFECTGGEVLWIAQEKQVKASNNTREIELRIGSDAAQVNHRTVTMDAAAFLLGNRTIVPMRFFQDALEVDLRWDSETGRITLTSK